METRLDLSPLFLVALAFTRDGVTPKQLVGRFAGADAAIDEHRAEALLDELCGHGLARVTRVSDSGSRYRATPTGERLLGASMAGTLDQADLLAEVEHMRTDLVTTIAHELRTPLTAIRTSVGLLLDPAVETNEEQRRVLLETIDRNATRMQRVVGDIVDLTRFRTGRIQLQLRRFDATDLARSAISSMTALVQSRDQTVRLEAPAEPVWVFGDYRRLEQTLVNLLSNAMKYSPVGSTVELAVALAGADVVWTVTDTGRGIEPSDQARLFERFFVAGGDRSDRSDTTDGIGLGLPISLSIVQAHDGRIDVESERGQGSRFRVLVPAAGPTEAFEE